MRDWRGGRAWLRPRPSFVVSLVAAATFIVAIRYGSFVAGGSDSYCYLSEARLWAQWSPIVQESLITQVNWPLADWSFTPLGYKPGLTAGTLVPVGIVFPHSLRAFAVLFLSSQLRQG